MTLCSFNEKNWQIIQWAKCSLSYRSQVDGAAGAIKIKGPANSLSRVNETIDSSLLLATGVHLSCPSLSANLPTDVGGVVYFSSRNYLPPTHQLVTKFDPTLPLRLMMLYRPLLTTLSFFRGVVHSQIGCVDFIVGSSDLLDFSWLFQIFRIFLDFFLFF